MVSHTPSLVRTQSSSDPESPQHQSTGQHQTHNRGQSGQSSAIYVPPLPYPQSHAQVQDLESAIRHRKERMANFMNPKFAHQHTELNNGSHNEVVTDPDQSMHSIT